jgi:hypothetical protein
MEESKPCYMAAGDTQKVNNNNELETYNRVKIHTVSQNTAQASLITETGGIRTIMGTITIWFQMSHRGLLY